jgi:hypothetical protein
MADHSEDKPLENKTQSQERAAPSSLVFQDEDENTPDFDRTINLGTPVIPSPDNHSFDSTIQFNSMESLFEEKPAKPISETGKADTHTVSEPEKPDDDAYDLGIDTDELEGLKGFMMEDDNGEDEPTVVLADMPDDDDDAPSNSHKTANEQPGNPGDKNNLLTAPAKKIKLTEADYADTDAISSKISQTEDEMSGDIPEDISEPENAIDSQAITAAANEAHALQDEPEMSAKDGTPEALPAKESAAPPAAQPRTGLATALGLIGIIGASGALWMTTDLSGRMDQLESQLAAMQSNRVTLDQRRDIASLNQRVDELGTQFAAHLKTIARTKEASPAPDVEKSSAPASVVTKPTVTAIKPAVNSGHGPWVVNLTSLSHAMAANNEVTRLKKLGIHAESIKVMTQGKIWYRIRVPGFASAENADRQRKILGNRLGIRDTWIGKR